jgi:MFS family permease
MTSLSSGRKPADLGFAKEAASSQASRLDNLGIGLLLLGVLLPQVNYFGVNVALNTIKRSLAASPTDLELIVAGYGTAYAVLLVTGGRLGDRYGRRRVFSIGLTGFLVASLGCGLAPSAVLLLVFRIFQGACAALVVPQVVATYHATLTGSRRAQAQSLYAAAAGSAIVIGQLLGGLLVTANIAGSGWRPVFLINIPIGLLALVTVGRAVPENRSAHPVSIDAPGALAFAATITALLLPLTLGQSDHWPLWSLITLALVPALGAVTIAVERRAERQGRVPLLAPSVLGLSSVRRGLSLHLPFMLGYGAFMFVFALVLQQGLHADPLAAGLATTPMAVPFLITSLYLPRLVTRLGARNVTALGGAALAAGLVGLIATIWFLWPHVGLLVMAPSLAVIGTGQALVFGSLFRLILAEVPEHHAGTGSGVLVTVQQAGLALGVATLGTLYTALNSHGTARAFAVTTGIQVLIAAAIATGARRIASPSS